MGVEEKTQNCSSNSPSGVGFGRSSSNSSKKTNGNNNNNKQKKVPQRGLGVAQLEKIRLEEQHKKAGSVLTPTPTASPTKPNPSVVSNNSIFRAPNSDIVRKQKSENGFEMPRHNVGIGKLWNAPPGCEYNGGNDHNKESGVSGILDPGFAFRPSLNNLPSFDHSNLIWTLPNFQRTQPPSPPPPPPPTSVNVSSATSMLSSSPSVLNYHTEPPSNQSYYSNYSTPMWSDDERMIGMKRSCPFSQENEAPSINFKLPTFVVPQMRIDETTCYGNRVGTYNLDIGCNSICREGPTCSTFISDSNSNIGVKENGSANGEFLTLAPPASNRTCPSQKFNFPPGYLAFHNPEIPDFTSFSYQGSSKDTIFQPGARGSDPRQAFYTFIPPAKEQLVRPAATMNICNGDVGEAVDLNLKL